MRCFGFTKKIRRCNNQCRGYYPFCATHKYLPIVVLFISFPAFLGLHAGLYQDFIKPIVEHFNPSFDGLTELEIDSIQFNSNKDVYNNIAMGLHNLSNEDFEESIRFLDKAIKSCSKYDLDDLIKWKTINYFLQEDENKAYENIEKFYQKNVNELSSDQLSFLCYLRAFTLSNLGETKRLEDFVNSIPANIEGRYVDLAKLNLLCNKEDKKELKIHLFNNENQLIDDIYYRKEQFMMWHIASSIFDSDEDLFERYLAYQKMQEAMPDLFESEYLLNYNELFNYYTISGNTRRYYQNDISNIIKSTYNQDGIPLFAKDNIAKFGIHVGSIESLYYILDKHGFLTKSIAGRLKSISEGNVNLMFDCKIQNEKIFVIQLYTKDGAFDDLEMLFNEDVKLNLIIIDKNGNFELIDLKISDLDIDTTCPWIISMPLSLSRKYDFFLYTKHFHDRILNFYGISAKEKTIKPIEVKTTYSSFRSHNFYCKEDSTGLHASWRFELNYDCSLENGSGIVYGQNETVLLEKEDILKEVELTFPNPGVHYFEKLDKSKLSLQKLFTKKLLLHNKEITDTSFVNQLVSSKINCYVNTISDAVYANANKELLPSISVFYVAFDDSEINFFERPKPLSSYTYLLLVKKYANDEIRVIGVYRVNDDELIDVYGL